MYNYQYCSKLDLEWSGRRARILLELQQHQPDVICLQEVEDFDVFQRQLQSFGYKGFFVKRTGQNKDGCALFWRTKRFELLSKHTVCYRGIRRTKDEAAEDFCRDNVGQFALLAERRCSTSDSSSTDNSTHDDDDDDDDDSQRDYSSEEEASDTDASEEQQQPPNPRIVCIANTHLLWNPKRGDIKLRQLDMFFSEMERVLSLEQLKHSNPQQQQIPVVLCGDFNSTPDSHIYSFIRDGFLDTTAIDRRVLDGQLKLPNQIDLRLQQQQHQRCIFEHRFHPFHSAYSTTLGSEPTCTTIHGGSRHTVDYIWVSPGLRSVQSKSVTELSKRQRKRLRYKQNQQRQQQSIVTETTTTTTMTTTTTVYSAQSPQNALAVSDVYHFRSDSDSDSFSKEVVGLPNASFPSDHIPILARFHWQL